jgi:uncharacterized lipoprotein YbaY
MKRLSLLFSVLVLTGCGITPDDGPAMQRVRGTLTFTETTALPPTAIAHVTILPISAKTVGDSAPLAQGDFPAKTGNAIPFNLKFPAEKAAGQGDYYVLAQVIDHGKVWYSNLSSPLRLSFLAEPGDLVIPLRRESLRL